MKIKQETTFVLLIYYACFCSCDSPSGDVCLSNYRH